MTYIIKRFFWAVLLAGAVLGAVGGFFTASFSVSDALAESHEGTRKFGTSPLTELKGVGPTGDSLGQAPRDPRAIIFDLVKIVLALIGIILTVLIIYAGYLWLTAGGNEEQVKKAKATLLNTVIGLIVISVSYAAVTFVINKIAVQEPGGLDCTPAERQINPLCK